MDVHTLSFPWRRRFIALALAALGLPFFGCATRPAEIEADASHPKLRFVRAYPIVGQGGAREPSGLCLFEGQLFSVCDKVDHTIFRIELDNGVARMVPHIRFDPPPTTEALDFEGITADEAGNFYLASETFARILRVTPEGESEWHFGSVLEAGRTVGLLTTRNAYLEGITRLDNGNFLLAAERQPRGLIEVDGETGEVVHVQRMNATRFGPRLGLLRRPDWTGLEFFDGRVFALFRNANMVVALDRLENGDFVESDDAWGFRHVEESSEFRYDDLRFGKAEGLAMDDRFIYIVLDNNQRPRTIDTKDKRPLLFIFENPVQPGSKGPPIARSR